MKLNILLITILLAFCIQVYANEEALDNGMEEEEEVDISSEDKISHFMMVSTATSTIPKTKPSKTIPTNLTPTTTTTTTTTITTPTSTLPDITVSNDVTLTKSTITFVNYYISSGNEDYGSIVTLVPKEVDDIYITCGNVKPNSKDVYDFDNRDYFYSYDDFQYQNTRSCRIYTSKYGTPKSLTPKSLTRSNLNCRKFTTYTTSVVSHIIDINYRRETINSETVHFRTETTYNVSVETVDKYTTCYSPTPSPTPSSSILQTTTVNIPEDQKVTTINYSTNGLDVITSTVMTVPKTIEDPIAISCTTTYNYKWINTWKKREIKINTSDRVVARAFSTKTIPGDSVSSTSSKGVTQSENTTTSFSSRVKTIPSSSGTLNTETTTSYVRVKTIPSSSGTLNTETTTSRVKTIPSSSGTLNTETTTSYVRVKAIPSSSSSTKEVNTFKNFVDQFGNYYKFYKTVTNDNKYSYYSTICTLFTSAQKPNYVNTSSSYCYVTSTSRGHFISSYYSTADTTIHTEHITNNQYLKTYITDTVSIFENKILYTTFCADSIPIESFATTVTTTVSPITTMNSLVTSTPIKTTKCVPEVVTITEKDLTTVTEKKTVTVTVYEDDTSSNETKQ